MKSGVLALGLVAALTLGTRGAAAQAPDGAALYKSNCAVCHGANGVPAEGMAKMFKNLKSFADSATLATVSEDSIITVMENGAGTGMKSFKTKLNHDQMAAVAAYVKTLPSAPKKDS